MIYITYLPANSLDTLKSTVAPDDFELNHEVILSNTSYSNLLTPGCNCSVVNEPRSPVPEITDPPSISTSMSSCVHISVDVDVDVDVNLLLYAIQEYSYSIICCCSKT